MKRWTVRICVLLLLGAIVNVAVAWACYRFIDPTNGSASRRSEFRWPPPPTWREEIVRRKPGRERREVTEWTWHGPWSLNEGGPRPTSEIVQYKQRAGFPMMAFETRSHVTNAVSIDVKANDVRLVWLGFAANTALYAMVLALMWLSPVLLETHRAMRGLCPKCAYPVGTNEVCTECGAAVNL